MPFGGMGLMFLAGTVFTRRYEDWIINNVMLQKNASDPAGSWNANRTSGSGTRP